MAQQKFEVPISPEKWRKYNGVQRRLIAREVIEHVINRTKKGLNYRNRPWRKPGDKYSKEYINSVEFKAANKKKTPVNLSATGDMLTSMQVLKNTKQELKIGYAAGSEENSKAEGHMTGVYGKNVTNKKREFLGITKKDFQAIRSKYPLNNPRKLQSTINKELAALGVGKEVADSITIRELEEIL
jgi:hypothetical protein